MAMIYFDLDGVLRDLCGTVLGFEPDDWDYRDKDGTAFVDIVGKNKEILTTAKPTPYVDVYQWCRNHKYKVAILTAQIKDWIPYAAIWIVNNLGIPFDLICVDKREDKLAFLQPTDILVEDYPFFKEKKDQIILVDRKYNRIADGIKRVKSPNELWVELLLRINFYTCNGEVNGGL